jgi:phenylacetate-CoA ligase
MSMTTISRPFTDPTPERVRKFIDAVPLYRDDTDDPTFWSDDQIQARRNELLQRQMGWLAEASPYYQKLFAREGVDATAIRSTDDLTQLPVTQKQDLMADPQAFRLKFEQPGLYDMTYQTVYTTGTTMGIPTPYEYTTHDFFGVLLGGRRQGKANYLVPGDRFLSAFPLSPLPHVSGFAGLISNSYGVYYLHGFGGMAYPEFPIHHRVEYVIDQIEKTKPHTIGGIGSFLRRMFADAAREGRDLSSIVVVQASGEVLTGKMRAHMHDNLAACGASEIMITGAYGFTEGGLPWMPCREGGPLHAAAPDQVFLEVLDPDTHERLPDGEAGLVALTHLNRRGMPLLRYLLGDLSAVSHARCPDCARGGESLLISAGSAHISRTKELLKIKGTLVNPQVIHDVVMNTEGVVEYQMIVANAIEGDPVSPDKLLLRIGLDPARTGEWSDEELRAAVKHATEVTPEVELVAELTEIYDPARDFKATRIVDGRVHE